MESGSGPQSPRPGVGPGPPPQSPAPEAPQSPAGPQSPGGLQGPGYSGPVPPGGWQQPPPAGVPAYGGQLAGWGRRLGATIIDGLIIVVPALIIMAVLGVGVAGSAEADSDAGIIGFVIGLMITALIIAVVSLLYAPLLMRRGGAQNGQTIGKQVTGIRVIRTSGEPMDFLWAGLREVVIKNFGVGIASSFTFGIAFLANYLWPLWDDENRALHDMLAQTRVVAA